MAEPVDLQLFDVDDAVLGNISATATLYSLLIEQGVITVEQARDAVKKTCAWLDEAERKGAAAFIRAHFRVLLED